MITVCTKHRLEVVAVGDLPIATKCQTTKCNTVSVENLKLECQRVVYENSWDGKMPQKESEVAA